MHDIDISEKLKELAQGKNRSPTARLSEIFDQIEAALGAGVRRKDIYQALADSEFEITFASFELAIHRIRKKRRSQNRSTIETTNQPVSTNTKDANGKSGLPFNLDFSIPPQFKRTRDGDK
jgi:hypothetical protein